MTDKELDAKREALIAGLQEDLSREYKAIIQYVIYSQVLDGPQYMDIADELEVHAHEELDHAIAIAKQLDYFGVYPTEIPKKVEVPEDAEGMLWADLRAEDETIDGYRQRIRQAQEMGEFALAEILQEITKQEQDHQIELAASLGVVADPRSRKETGPKS